MLSSWRFSKDAHSQGSPDRQGNSVVTRINSNISQSPVKTRNLKDPYQVAGTFDASFSSVQLGEYVGGSGKRRATESVCDENRKKLDQIIDNCNINLFS